jgi:hypothetical protein
VIGPTPLLDFFKRGEVAQDVRLLAAQGALAPRAVEQLSILMLLLHDADPDIQRVSAETLDRIPTAALQGFLARSDVPDHIREFFAARGVHAGGAPLEADEPFVDTSDELGTSGPASANASGTWRPASAGPNAPIDEAPVPGEPMPEADASRESIVQQVTKMAFTDRLKAAVKGSREMRAILIRDPNKMIAAAVLSSPKLTDAEVESYARMANVSEDVLRIIGSNRAWTKNYGVIVGLARNPKTPLALSLNLLPRLHDRDVSMLSLDRNVPEPLRIAARKKVVDSTSNRR